MCKPPYNNRWFNKRRGYYDRHKAFSCRVSSPVFHRKRIYRLHFNRACDLRTEKILDKRGKRLINFHPYETPVYSGSGTFFFLWNLRQTSFQYRKNNRSLFEATDSRRSRWLRNKIGRWIKKNRGEFPGVCIAEWYENKKRRLKLLLLISDGPPFRVTFTKLLRAVWVIRNRF